MEHNLQGENTCVWMYVCELHLASLKGFATLIFIILLHLSQSCCLVKNFNVSRNNYALVYWPVDFQNRLLFPLEN